MNNFISPKNSNNSRNLSENNSLLNIYLKTLHIHLKIGMVLSVYNIHRAMSNKKIEWRYIFYF